MTSNPINLENKDIYTPKHKDDFFYTELTELGQSLLDNSGLQTETKLLLIKSVVFNHQRITFQWIDMALVGHPEISYWDVEITEA